MHPFFMKHLTLEIVVKQGLNFYHLTQAGLTFKK